MKDLIEPKIHFWPYDLFGYLLPGFVVLTPLIEFNKDVRDMFTARFSESSILDIAAITGIAYAVGHIIAALSSLILERFVLRYTHGYPASQVFRLDAPAQHCRLTELIFYAIPGKCHAFPSDFTKRYFEIYNRLFHQKVTATNASRVPDDLYWNAALYASVHHPTGFRIAQHFVELYGFARNTCMGLFIVMFYPLAPGWSIQFESTKRNISGWQWSLGSFIAAYFMYANYTKLLRRQNDHIFRSFFVAAQDDARLNQPGVVSLR